MDVALRLKHDLGKYLTLSLRWLPEQASPHERREALREALLETRRAVSGPMTAAQVWEPFHALLSGEAEADDGSRLALAADPDVALLSSLMEHLGAVAARWPTWTDDDVERAIAEALRVPEAIQRLIRRLREEG